MEWKWNRHDMNRKCHEMEMSWNGHEMEMTRNGNDMEWKWHDNKFYCYTFPGVICGVIFNMFAGQPLSILGSTGPVLVFESITFQFCDTYGESGLLTGEFSTLLLPLFYLSNLWTLKRFLISFSELDYMSFRFWIGIWTAFILLLMVAFDLSYLVCYITRFTEESFATLIALIFIQKAFSKVGLHWDVLCGCRFPNFVHPVQSLELYASRCPFGRPVTC